MCRSARDTPQQGLSHAAPSNLAATRQARRLECDLEEDSRTGKVTNMIFFVKSSVDVFWRLEWNVLHIYIYII